MAGSSQCSLWVEPSELVVRFGDPVSANCCSSQESFLGWIGLSVDHFSVHATFLAWTEESLTSWSIKPSCYIMTEGTPCSVNLSVTVYQPPERVSLSFRNHSEAHNSSGLLEEGWLYSLQCEVWNVAPVQNMTVTFYRDDVTLGVQSSWTLQKTPVNETLIVEYKVSREDHGAQFWCEAILALGPGGPQPPPVVMSQYVIANVHFREEQVEAPPTRSSREHFGATLSAQGQRGQKQHPDLIWPRGPGLALGSNALIILALLLIHTTICL